MIGKSRAKRHILIVGVRMLTPDFDSGSQRIYMLSLLLQQMNFQVTYFACIPGSWPPYDKSLTEDISRLKKKGILIPSLEEMTSLADFLRKKDIPFETVILSDEFTAANHLKQVRKILPQSRILFDTVDLHYIRYFREAQSRKDKKVLMRAVNAKQSELEAVRNADATIVVSEEEKQIIEKECPNTSVFVLSSIYDSQPSTVAFEARKDILFVGAFDHSPNLDAIAYFTKKIFPYVLLKLPDIRFYIVGSRPPGWIKDLSSDKIIVTGYVQNLKILFDQCRLSVAPLRFGAGIKGKILTSMSFGVPVVATGIAAEGLSVMDGHHLFIAESSEDFIEKTTRLYLDGTLWTKMSQNGYRLIEEHFSMKTFRRNLENILNSLSERKSHEESTR